MSSKTENFINKIYPYAVDDMKKSGILASLTIAQAILESGWGESSLAKKANNLFGIKKGNWTGKVFLLSGCEWRAYDSWLDSIKDHSDLLQKPRYAKVLQAKDYKTACNEVRLAGYCTSENYSNQLIQLIEKYNLAKYDIVYNEKNDNNITSDNNKELYRVRKSWDDVKTQIGAYYNLENAKIMTDNNDDYCVFDLNGNIIYKPFKPYLIKIAGNKIPIYKNKDLNSEIVGYVTKDEVFTIIEEDNTFLKLKSGKGWLFFDKKNMFELKNK